MLVLTRLVVLMGAVSAFAPQTPTTFQHHMALFSTEEAKADESAFQPLEEAPATEASATEEEETKDVFDKVESLGRGAAKVSRLTTLEYDCLSCLQRHACSTVLVKMTVNSLYHPHILGFSFVLE